MLKIEKTGAALTILLMACFIQACGFKLRGSVSVDPALYPIHILNSGGANKITPLLRNAMQQQGIVIINDRSQAKTVINLHGEKFDRRVLTVSTAGQVQEYALSYFVDFSVMDSTGSELIKKTSIKLERDLRFDESALLAKTQEATIIQQHMLEDAVRQLLRRLQFIAT